MWRRSYGGNFERDGNKWYLQHYINLEERLRDENRPYLKWKVQDGCEPLCKYLEKPVPDRSFPSGNAPKAFQAKMDTMNQARLGEAKRNILAALVILLALTAMLYAWLLS